MHPKHNGLAYAPKWGHIYTLPRYKLQFGLFGGAGALWSLNINQDTDNIHEIPPYSMHLGPLICTMDITIQYKQPTVQFDPLTCSICVDFACFYVEFAFRHYAKKSWKSKLKKKLTSCKYFLLKLRENLVQARPRVVVTSNFGICQVEFSLNRGWKVQSVG